MEIIYTPSYYYIGHFSKYILPNAKRISTTTSHTHLLSTSFLNENNEIIAIVMNQTSSKIAYKLYIETFKKFIIQKDESIDFEFLNDNKKREI
ncbi:MAG: hypothetical protein K9J30_11920 [Bacteroidales bacterium]|nr:hypothetical protein [Bacteroidales bacterium]